MIQFQKLRERSPQKLACRAQRGSCRACVRYFFGGILSCNRICRGWQEI